jgi:hypothetical protein
VILKFALILGVSLLVTVALVAMNWKAPDDTPVPLEPPETEPVAVETTSAWSPAKADFSLRVRGAEWSYRVMAVPVLPGETLSLRVLPGHSHQHLTVESEAGTLKNTAANWWQWKAPETPGIVQLQVLDSTSLEAMTLNAFVQTPAGKVTARKLNGYMIGDYPARPYQNRPIYLPPKGFIEVTEENRDTPVSPHLTLGQFLCKQQGDFPKYVVLNELLLIKLETLLAELNLRGYPASTLHIMSGYRTPFYNRAIGNGAYSLHQWGLAADIFVDENGDGMMDDLNGDGRIDYRDAQVIARIVEELHHREDCTDLLGGLACYEKSVAHGPFVHVDVRGRKARWGISAFAR